MTDDEKFAMLRFRVAEEELARTVKTFCEEGLDPILIKGWAAARYYSVPSARRLGDIDLAFGVEEYDRACRLRESHGLNRTDLHAELRHLDTESWENLIERSRLVPCVGSEIRVLSDEDHLRVIAVHWLNDGGAYRDRLQDIAQLLLSTRSTFDWDLCFRPLSETRRLWIKTAVALADRYTDSDLGFVPFAAEFSWVPEWVHECLDREWRSGHRLIPLHFVLTDPVGLLKQLRKRFPPNALQSTIEVEGEIDDSPRFRYQAENVFRRIAPSYKRVVPALRRLFTGR